MEPTSGHFINQVKQTIRRYGMLGSGDTVLIAVSGGPDSSALAHVLTALREEFNLSLHIGHLNHMFRGAAAQQDAEAVEALAARLGVPCTIEAYDVPARLAKTGESTQAGARTVRYEFLDRIAAKVGANRIALGHNADDQAETVLMHLLRGAGTTGLSGMPPVRESRYIRPLIGVPRDQIEAYCRQHDIEYRVDQSNLKPVYLRNKIRLQLLPQLKREYNPNLAEALGRTAAILRDETEYLDTLAAQELARARQSGDAPDIAAEDRRFSGVSGNLRRLSLRLSIIGELPSVMLKRVLRLAFSEVRGSLAGVELSHVESAVELVEKGRTGARVVLPGGLTVRRGYQTLVLRQGRFTGPFRMRSQIPLPIPGRAEFPPGDLAVEGWIERADGRGDIDRIVSEVRAEGPGSVAIDLDQLQGRPVLRTRQPGDRFRPFGAPGERKLKEVLIDLKVPAEQRDRVPLLADDAGILWVVGIRTAQRGALGPETARVLRLRVVTGNCLPSGDMI